MKMKSKTVKDLMTWLNSSTRKIDLPRIYGEKEVKKLTEIAEIELLGDIELLEKKVNDFKKMYNF